MKHTPEQYVKSAKKHNIPEGPYTAITNDLVPYVQIVSKNGTSLGKLTKHNLLALSIESIPDLLIERDILAASNARLREALTLSEDSLGSLCYGEPAPKSYFALEQARAALSATPSTPDPRDEQILKLRTALEWVARNSCKSDCRSRIDYRCDACTARAALEGGA